MKESSVVQKRFSELALLLTVIYNSLCAIQLYGRRIVEVGFLGMGKYNLPFPDGWCMIFEWSAPFLLCVGYVAVWAGCTKLHSILTGIMAAGFIETSFGRYGLKLYRFRSLGFWGNDSTWFITDARPGRIMPLHYAGWYLAAMLLLMAAPKLIRCVGGDRKKERILLYGLWGFCLCQSFLYNTEYWGEYTVFYIIRNLLLLPLIFFPLLEGNRGFFEETPGKEKSIQSKEKKNLKMLKIGFCVCVLLHIIIGTGEMRYLYFLNETGITIFDALIRYLTRNYTVILVAAASAYIVKKERKRTNTGILAVLVSIAFLMEWFLLWDFVRHTNEVAVRVSAAKEGITAWCIISYLFFTWLWKRTKKTDILFLILLYVSAIGGSGLERFGTPGNYGITTVSFVFGALYLVMFAIVIYVRMISARQDKEEKGRYERSILIFCLLYALMAAYDRDIYSIFYHIFDAKRTCSVLWKIFSAPESNANIYAAAFFLIASFLAYALKKEEMQIFCSTMTFATVFYLDVNKIYQIGEEPWFIGTPLPFIAAIFLLFVFLFLVQLFPQKEKIIRRIFLLITSGILFYEYILPFLVEIGTYTASDSEPIYRYPTYIVAMVALVVLGIMASLGRGGLKQINTDESTNESPIKCNA